jgi:hypothetical protein
MGKASKPTSQHFRQVIPDLNQGKFKEVSKHDAHSWRAEFFKNPVAKSLMESWMGLWTEPFVGLSSDGT